MDFEEYQQLHQDLIEELKLQELDDEQDNGKRLETTAEILS